MKRFTILIFLISLIGLALAQEDGFVQEEPHEHGAASLNLVLDGETLNLEFISPAVNLVGFEYEPATDAERAAVEDAMATLESGAGLFGIPDAAQCEVGSVEVEREVVGDEHSHEGEGEEHEGEEHEGEHAEGEESGEEGATHSEFHARYNLTCAQPDRLGGIAVQELFARFPGIEDLDVQYVLPSGQGAAELGPTTTANLDF